MADLPDLESHYRVIHNPKYEINDIYKLVYLSRKSYQELLNSLSVLRKEKVITSVEYHTIRCIFLHHYKNSLKIAELDRMQPRVMAQKYIGKQDVRVAIFCRDKHKCLCCGVSENLTIDHIVPISKEGKNELSNLQTLCKSCNSKKGSKTKDYRYGGR